MPLQEHRLARTWAGNVAGLPTTKAHLLDYTDRSAQPCLSFGRVVLSSGWRGLLPSRPGVAVPARDQLRRAFIAPW